MSDDAKYYDRFADSKPEEPKKVKPEKVISGGTALSLSKVFGYMFFGLLITTIISLGLGAIYRYILGVDYANGVDANFQLTSVIALIVLLIASLIGIIVLSFVVPFMVARGKHSILVPSIIYTVLMGIMLSTIAIFVPWSLLGLTFGITALVFGIMALIAIISKSRLNGLAIVAMGLFFGAGILALALWIMMLFGVFFGTLYWIISFAIFAAVMLITIWDIARIKSIAEKGEMTNNISLYCAYILYNDFIVIFLRILRFVLIIFSKSK